MKQVDVIFTITGKVDVEDYMPDNLGKEKAKAEASKRVNIWVQGTDFIDITGPDGSLECTLFNLMVSGEVEAEL